MFDCKMSESNRQHWLNTLNAYICLSIEYWYSQFMSVDF